MRSVQVLKKNESPRAVLAFLMRREGRTAFLVLSKLGRLVTCELSARHAGKPLGRDSQPMLVIPKRA